MSNLSTYQCNEVQKENDKSMIMEVNANIALSALSPGDAFITTPPTTVYVLLSKQEEVVEETGVSGKCLVYNRDSSSITLMDLSVGVRKIARAKLVLNEPKK